MKSHFESNDLERQLDSMFILCRLALALSCCERLIPNYVVFSHAVDWGRPEILRMAVDQVWASLHTGSYDLDKITGLIEECNQVVPDTNDFTHPYTSAALDAGTAVVATLECCLDGNSEHVMDVISFSRDTIDMFVRARHSLESGVQSDEVVATHPFMTTELRRLSEDVEMLCETKVFNSEFVEQFKQIALSRGSNIV